MVERKGPRYEYKTVKVSGTIKSGGGILERAKAINKQAKRVGFGSPRRNGPWSD